MDFSGYRYYKLSHDLLRYLGLWNPKAGWLERFQRLVFCTAFAGTMLCQIVVNFMNEYNIRTLSKEMVYVMLVYMFLNKYLMFCVNINRMRTFLSRVQHDWNTLQNIDEYNILKKYTEDGKFITSLHLIFLGLSTLFIMILEFLPKLFDVVAPFIQSRPQNFPIMSELGLKQNVLLRMFINIVFQITVIVGVITVTASESFVLMLLQHICGMFKITSYRIQHAINEEDKQFDYVKLFHAVLTHQRTIEFADMLQRTIASSYSCLLASGSISMIMNMYHFSQVIMVSKDVSDMSEAVFFASYQYCYLYVCNNLAQMVIDHSSDIFTETYDTQWYTIPPPAQKLLVFVMQRSMKSNTFTLVKIYVPSRQGFSMICNTILSYFTFLLSVQN